LNSDLRAFWERTREELRQIEPRPEFAPEAEHSDREYTTRSVVLTSYGGQRLRGWYSVPIDRPSRGRFPAVLAVPGYSGVKAIPTQIVQSGFAVLTLFPRAQGESKREWDLPRGTTKLTYHVTDREQFYYRAGYMDCVRGIDFLACQPEVDPDRIGMWSRSQGGGFTLVTASLDARVAAAVAEEPFLCNYPVAVDVTTNPYVELHDYLQAHPEDREAVLETLATFDPLNLVDAITCPTLVNVGMRDETCPYRTIAPVFERIRALKSLMVYPDLTHATCTDFNMHALAWLDRYLAC
jgi:cephalosporin-C deacetylase